MKTDLIIIGSGPGGYRAAEHAARNGLQVVVFEKAHAGGTCLNAGCIPTKTFCHEASSAAHNFSKATERKNAVVEQLRTGVEQLMTMPGINFVKGEAAFKDAQTIACNGETYTAEHIIIATGSKAKLPPIEGINSPNVLTSTELLNIEHVPERLAIVGAGVIGMEFASIFNQFGSDVTVIEFMKECLPNIDSDIAKRLRKSMEKQGVKFYMQSAVKSIDNECVRFERKGKEETVCADTILIATGRCPNTEGLNLDAAGIVCEKSGINVNPQTFEVLLSDSSPHPIKYYAIGDVNGQALLAHAATMQGIQVVNNILAETKKQPVQPHIRFEVMPAAVFTTPEVASVGATEDQCKEQGREYICRKGFYRSNGKALAMNETEGMLKLLSDSAGHIIGCHVMGAHAADIAQEVAVLMNFNATIAQLRNIVHIHPTLGEILQTTAEQPT